MNYEAERENQNLNLRAKIRARNRLHKEIQMRMPFILSVLKPFVGGKFYKKNGDEVGEIKAVLPKIEVNMDGLHVYLSKSIYSLYAHFRITEGYTTSDGSFSRNVYAEQDVFVGEIENGQFLSKLAELEKLNLNNLRTDYNEQEVVELRGKLEKVEAEQMQLTSDLRHFGKHDNN